MTDEPNQPSPMVSDLIPCPSCAHQISVDAVSCPQCGRDNTWRHPLLVQVIAHLETLDRVTLYEGRGHTLRLWVTDQNTRQKIGTFLVAVSVVFLILGMFIPSLLGLSVLLMTVGGAMTAFGLSFQNHHELNIDLRTPNRIVGVHDAEFWADVIGIVRRGDGPHSTG